MIRRCSSATQRRTNNAPNIILQVFCTELIALHIRYIVAIHLYIYIYDSVGIVVGAWPCGTVTMVGELYGAESKSQVYGSIHTFLQENHPAAENLGKY